MTRFFIAVLGYLVGSLIIVTHPSAVVRGFSFQYLPAHHRSTRRSSEKRKRTGPGTTSKGPLSWTVCTTATSISLQSSFAEASSSDSDGSSSFTSNANTSSVRKNKTSGVVTAQDIRQITVTNSEGESVTLGEMMGSGTSIVVFLRHLGCFNCWSCAREWTQLLAKQERANDDDRSEVVGPIYVSIGDQQRLNAFLEKNPDVPRSQIFVDGYDFSAYKEAGFGRFDEKPSSVTEGVVPRPIELGGWKGWWTFLSSFAPLAPVTPDMKFPEMLTPEGLFWVGGTLVIKGDEIVYRWDDRISGDHPDASKVLAIAREASSPAN
jgi:hypothetical protein